MWLWKNQNPAILRRYSRGIEPGHQPPGAGFKPVSDLFIRALSSGLFGLANYPGNSPRYQGPTCFLPPAEYPTPNDLVQRSPMGIKNIPSVSNFTPVCLKFHSGWYCFIGIIRKWLRISNKPGELKGGGQTTEYRNLGGRKAEIWGQKTEDGR